MTRGYEGAVRLGFVLLAGCPQFLNDDFKEEPSDPPVVLFESDASVEQGMGGSGGTDGTSGAAGAGGSDVGSGSSGSSAGGSAGAAGVGGSDVGGPGPVVVSAVPANGARGVAADTALVFTFSAPMNTSSVEAAYVSSELPAAQVSFTWSAGNTVLSVRPNSPLQVATGSDPATVVATSYAVDFTSQARDQAGNALVAEHVGFTVVRSITQQLDAVQDRDLTGNWRDDSTYGLNFCERVDTTICAGDGAATYKAFVTFDLGDVPADLVSISSAELSTTLDQLFGTPFSALGPLQLEHTEFGIIGDAAYAAPGLSAPRSMATGAVAGDTLLADVLADVQADWGLRARSQFRLLFASPTNSDAVADQVVCSWSSLHLTLSYLAP
jgi:hypothetical protein